MSSGEVTSPNSGLRAGNIHRFRVGRPEGTREKQVACLHKGHCHAGRGWCDTWKAGRWPVRFPPPLCSGAVRMTAKERARALVEWKDPLQLKH
ncbi:hypothetical protein CEXT_38221 [Caerostris extrusa]|uniref:Uncharacterized protein n=1 Tax=Caerostris extrusa TaxID=172846 RepID=A0AAV4WCS0_CAEEX|nr:hypothetical protein CEXT_38221 [Caerostris extrusa]